MTHTDKPHMTLPNGDVLFEGDYGVTRGGDVVGPMVFDQPSSSYPWDDGSSKGFKSDGRSFYSSPDECDIIAKHQHAATPEVGTLRELNVKPGDLVQYVGMQFEVLCVNHADTDGYSLRRSDDGQVGNWVGDDNAWRIISRAAKPLKSVDGQSILGAHDGTLPDDVLNVMELPHGHASLSSGEVVDLTAITTPFGLLPPDVQQALRDHGGPWEWFTHAGNWQKCDPGWNMPLTYRVRPLPPAPKVETVKRSLHGEKFMGYVAIDLVDGEPDWSTMRKWEAL